MNETNTKLCLDLISDLNNAIQLLAPDKVFILCDTNTQVNCLGFLRESAFIEVANLIVIPHGDENKNLTTAHLIWDYLSEHRATRKSLLINLGGGMVTDIGGFCASTFKRGINYLNVSTTLLGAVDAATGGKTGINFQGLKNEIGVFAPAKYVFIDPVFFKTLDPKNLRSGFAEMLKHALIDSPDELELILAYDIDEFDVDKLKPLLENSFRIKERIVEKDPYEVNIRKALNFGHTFGHAFESWSYSINSPVLHGYAVAWGMLCELYLSYVLLFFPKNELLRLKHFIKEYYGIIEFSCNEYETLYAYMLHDKKNEGVDINFTLLAACGEIKINQTATKQLIFECFDWLREG